MKHILIFIVLMFSIQALDSHAGGWDYVWDKIYNLEHKWKTEKRKIEVQQIKIQRKVYEYTHPMQSRREKARDNLYIDQQGKIQYRR